MALAAGGGDRRRAGGADAGRRRQRRAPTAGLRHRPGRLAGTGVRAAGSGVNRLSLAGRAAGPGALGRHGARLRSDRRNAAPDRPRLLQPLSRRAPAGADRPAAGSGGDAPPCHPRPQHARAPRGPAGAVGTAFLERPTEGDPGSGAPGGAPVAAAADRLDARAGSGRLDHARSRPQRRRHSQPPDGTGSPASTAPAPAPGRALRRARSGNRPDSGAPGGGLGCRGSLASLGRASLPALRSPQPGEGRGRHLPLHRQGPARQAGEGLSRAGAAPVRLQSGAEAGFPSGPETGRGGQRRRAPAARAGGGRPPGGAGGTPAGSGRRLAVPLGQRCR